MTNHFCHEFLYCLPEYNVQCHWEKASVALEQALWQLEIMEKLIKGGM